MTSIIIDIFEDNFIDSCIKSSFLNTNCIIGTSTLFISIVFLLLNILALFKLIYFYGKINFETNLIIFSIFQIFIIQLVIITSYEVLIECFNLFQILIITLLLRKMIILSNQNINKNVLFVLINTINLSSFIIYIMFLFKNKKSNTYSFILFHSSLYAISSIFLAFYSNSLIKVINKLELKSSEQFLSSNSSVNNQIFYSMRKKQIKPLYKINLISSFLEFMLVLSILLIPNDNFEQNQFKIIPNSLLGYISLYLFLLICLFNISSNFLCFFWKIREQFKEGFFKNNKRRVIDNRYIRRETIIMENEDPTQVNEFLENDNNKNNQIKFEKSIYMSSFADISEEKEKEDELKTNKNDVLIEKKNEDVNEERNNELKENFIDRESIPCNISSIEGINRNTTFSVSK